jgi:pilus assembly protein Flp/PilA
MIEQYQFMAAWMQAKFGVVLAADRQEGQGLVEYALILVLVSIAAVVAMGTLATKINTVFGQITGAL